MTRRESNGQGAYKNTLTFLEIRIIHFKTSSNFIPVVRLKKNVKDYRLAMGVYIKRCKLEPQ